MSFENFDEEIDGQITIDEWINPTNQMIAVSDIFARAKKQMNIYEYKAFVTALAQISWTKDAKTNIVYLDKKDLADYCGVHSDPDHLSVDLYEKIKDLPRNSYITISDKDLDFYDSGVFVTRVTMLKNRVKIKFEEDYLGLFTGLKNGEYITLWADDLLQMDNSANGVRAMALYEHLRQHSDTRKTNWIGMGVKAFKEMWDIPKEGPGSYMTREGHFDRPNFEKYVLEPVLENLARCKMINLVLQPNGKYYEKVKKGSKVLGYRLYWDVSNRPSVASGEEVKQIREAVDKDPQILKVAKNIVDGKNKPSEKKKIIPGETRKRSSEDWKKINQQMGPSVEEMQKMVEAFENEKTE